LASGGGQLAVPAKFKIIAKKRFRSYKDLEIWQLAREVALEIHKMSLEQLPEFEQFETGSLKEVATYESIHVKYPERN